MNASMLNRISWLFILFLLCYWLLASIFSTGYESKGWEHFAHVFKGIDLEFGECDKLPVQIITDKKSTKSEKLNFGDLVSVPYDDGTKICYIFLKAIDFQGGWRVVNQPKSDYKGFMGWGGKIWLIQLPAVRPGAYLILAGIGKNDAELLIDGSELNILPSHLRYSALRQIELDK